MLSHQTKELIKHKRVQFLKSGRSVTICLQKNFVEQDSYFSQPYLQGSSLPYHPCHMLTTTTKEPMEATRELTYSKPDSRFT